MIGPLVVLLALTSVAAVLLMQDVLWRLNNPQAHDWMTHVELAARFKWIVLGLAVTFLIVLNASVLVLMRAAAMILNPVDRLVTASRELAAEHFDYRIELPGRRDEFSELASAYNHLAAQLQANERKRLETLGQTALTLNHELNNAMGMIQLQLKLLSKRTSPREPVTTCLVRIGEGLERMSRTVESLKHVKRIVLTDYLAGTKMLDLQRSTQDNEPSADAPSETPASIAGRQHSI